MKDPLRLRLIEHLHLQIPFQTLASPSPELGAREHADRISNFKVREQFVVTFEQWSLEVRSFPLIDWYSVRHPTQQSSIFTGLFDTLHSRVLAAIFTRNCVPRGVRKYRYLKPTPASMGGHRHPALVVTICG